MWSLTSQRERRTSGPENFQSQAKKDFFNTIRHEPPLPANGCTRARSLSNSLISRNSRSARSASASSKGRSCRHCSDHRKSQAGRSSASRHRTRNNLGLDRYTKGAGCGAPCAKPKLSGRKLEGVYSGADDSPAGSRSRASVALAGYEPAQPARRPAAAIGRSTKREARHKHTIEGRPLGGDSNLSAQSSATASGSLAKRPLCAKSRHSRIDPSWPGMIGGE